MTKFVAIIIILASILAFFFQQEKPETVVPPESPVDMTEKVNKHLQEIEFRKKAMEIKSGVKVETPSNAEGGSKNKGLDGEIGEHIGNEISSEIGSAQYDEYRREFSEIELGGGENREAYIKQFIENARKDGLDVTVDKDYQIIDIKKIRE